MKHRKLPFHTLVLVSWEDSSYVSGWDFPHDGHYGRLERAMHEISSIGFVIGSTEKALSLAHTLSEVGAALNPLAIPWGCVTALTVLKKP